MSAPFHSCNEDTAYVTVVTSTTGPVNKKIYLHDGTVRKDPNAQIHQGLAKTVPADSAEDLSSLIANPSFSLLLKPESLGTITTSLSFISSRASCKEYKRELPISLYGPERGTSKPTLSDLLSSLLKRLELKINSI